MTRAITCADIKDMTPQEIRDEFEIGIHEAARLRSGCFWIKMVDKATTVEDLKVVVAKLVSNVYGIKP